VHIIIGFLTALAGLVWALNSLQRSGIDLGWLNPVSWNRRRKWHNKFSQVPLYNLKNSMEVAAVIILGILKQEGEITREQKRYALDVFKNTFSLSDDESVALYGGSTFLLKDVHTDIDELIPNIIEPCQDDFQPSQIESLLVLAKEASELEGPATEAQKRTITAITDKFNGSQPKVNWK